MKFIEICFVLFLLFLSKNSFSQVVISGKVKSEKEVLIGANVIAKPLTKDAKFAYSVVDDTGKFSVTLSKNSTYKFTISFIGYITLKEQVLTLESNINKDFILKEDPNELEEITINYKEPIRIKKDTTTYRTDAFTNGKERKLRQVLKKLPGVEVDRKGNVTVKGKKVNTVLVENKKFFTGDSKMAVNNIPADVIDEIQVIEDYNESTLLKGLENSEEVALNINLKEDKKKFIFGDLEVGGGVKKQYVVHPTLFRYSPKVNINFIGDFNNTGNKSFTLRDYIRYNGGFDLGNFSSIYNSPFAKLLREKDFNKNNHLFGAFSTQVVLNPKNDINAFIIGLDDITNSQSNIYRDYTTTKVISLLDALDEQRQKMILGSLELKSAPNDDVRIQFNNKVELSKVNVVNQVERNLDDNVNNYNGTDKLRQFSVSSHLKMEKRFSSFHTSQAKVSFKSESNTEKQTWLSSDNIFSPQIPLQEFKNYKVLQNGFEKKYDISAQLKHFWVINPVNHLYLTVRNNLCIDSFKGYAYQNVFSGDILLSDYTNNINDKRIKSSFDVEYKKLIGNAFLTLKISYLNYNRFHRQFDNDYNRRLNLLLPEVNFKWDIDRKRELSFKYRLTNEFPDIKQLSIAKKISSFNNIYTGNINLNEEYYHYLKLSFRKYRNYGWSFYPSISYRIKKNTIQNTFISQNVFNVRGLFNNPNSNKEISTDFRITYNYKHWKTQLSSSYKNAQFNSFLNSVNVLNKNNSVSLNAYFSSTFLKAPNVEVLLSQSYNYSKNKFYTNISDMTRLDFNINYEVGNWQFNSDLLYMHYSNRSTKTTNSFDNIGASVFYQQEESPWGFELKANNIGNNRYRLTSNLTNVLFSETRDYVMPRMILFKVVYKL